MKVTVCELRNDAAGLKQDWLALIDHVKSQKSDLEVVARPKTPIPGMQRNRPLIHKKFLTCIG